MRLRYFWLFSWLLAGMTGLLACSPVVFQCIKDTECPPTAPFCLAGLCRQCRSSLDCPNQTSCVNLLCSLPVPSEASADGSETSFPEEPTEPLQERAKETSEPSPDPVPERLVELFKETPLETLNEDPSDGSLEPRPELQAEPRPELKPEPRPEPRPELKPEPRPEPLPEPKPEPTCPNLCPGGFACSLGVCRTSCTSDSQCHPGFLCIKNRCDATAVSLSPGQPLQWADGKAASDCLAYLLGEPPSGNPGYKYIGASTSERYFIQPSGVSTPFAVHCDMTTQGGGWTLVLKADGSKPTFGYDQLLWTNPSQGPGQDAAFNRNEALLPSYSSVPLSQMLLLFHDTAGKSGAPLILPIDGTSLSSLLQSGDYHPFQKPVASTLWETSFPTSSSSEISLYSRCRGHGLNLLTYSNLTGQTGRGLRIGVIGFESSSQCQEDFASFVGIGSRRNPSHPTATPFPTTGHFYEEQGSAKQTQAAFAYLYVRDLRNRNFWFTSSNALRPADDFFPRDCLHLPFLGGDSASDQTFWLKPLDSTPPYSSLCQNSHNDGGWSLLLKADGSKSTFRYNESIWTSPNNSRIDPGFNTTEAMLPTAYRSLSSRQFLIQMAPLPLSPGSLTPQQFASLILNVRLSSFEWAIQNSNPLQFANSIGSAAWRALLPSSELQTSCTREGFNLRSSQPQVSSLQQIRFGIIGDGAQDCSSPDSAIGFGLLTNPLAGSKPPVGNLHLPLSAPHREISAFGILSLRDLASAPSSSPDSDIVLVTKDSITARERRNGTLESSCRAYRYPPMYKGPAASSGLYRLQPHAQGSNPYVAYCDMDTQGGGWTLALKADGTKSTFSYNAGLWTNNAVLASNQPDLDRNEAKLESFNSLPFSEILLQMQPSAISGIASRKSVRLLLRASSLLDLFDNKNLPTYAERGAGRSAWKALFPQTSFQRRFLLEGANLRNGLNTNLVRLGIIANNEASETSADSYLGIGGHTNFGPSVGCFPSSYQPDNGSLSTSAFGWVWLR